MANVTIKNIPDKLYRRLKESAEAHRRSINSEVIVCLEHFVLQPQIETTKALKRIRELRTKTAGHLLTESDLRKLKREGRP